VSANTVKVDRTTPFGTPFSVKEYGHDRAVASHRAWLRNREINGASKARNGAMSREIVNAICRTFPGAEVSDPWGGGHDAWKVGGKMFACIGAVMPGVSVKTDSVETAQMLMDAGVGVKAPYFHRSWVNLPWGTSEDELRHRLTASYRLVRASLTKKAQAELDPF
jgi:predicted DNA-binding protein (MmcQ/YjbR family)